jgi:hypothetical protein
VPEKSDHQKVIAIKPAASLIVAACPDQTHEEIRDQAKHQPGSPPGIGPCRGMRAAEVFV